MKNYITNGQTLLCAGCIERGFTKRDFKGYACAGCRNTYGRNKYDEGILKSVPKQRVAVFCAGRARREASICNGE